MKHLSKEQQLAEADEVDRLIKELCKELEADGSRPMPPSKIGSMQVFMQPRLPVKKPKPE